MRDLEGLNRLGKENLPTRETIADLLSELLALVYPGLPRRAGAARGGSGNAARRPAGQRQRQARRRPGRHPALLPPAGQPLPGPVGADQRRPAGPGARRRPLRGGGAPADHGVPDRSAGHPAAGRPGRARRLRGRPGGHELGGGHPLLPGAVRGDRASAGASAAGTGRAAAAAHDERVGPPADRHRHPPGRQHRSFVLHRPRHGRGHRRDDADRRRA